MYTSEQSFFFIFSYCSITPIVKLLWQQELKLQSDVATAQRQQFILCYFILMLLTIIR